MTEPAAHAVPPTDQLALARQHAIAWLITAREPDGFWRDFRLAAGVSDEWITGCVGALLAATADSAARSAAAMAWEHLCTRRAAAGGWGYNAATPLDGDSTGWGVRLADALGMADGERGTAALACLRQHLKPGGVTTYATDGPIRRFIRHPWYEPMRGWCATPQLCVTAAVANVPALAAALLPDLIAAQRPDGSWVAYWWMAAAYTAAFACEAIAAHGTADQRRTALPRAADWAAGQIAAGEGTDDPFTAALLTRVLLAANGDRAALALAQTRLLAQQRPDGSWPGTARLRVPLPDDRAPDQYTDWVIGGLIQGSIALDHTGVFTTALALAALRAL